MHFSAINWSWAGGRRNGVDCIGLVTLLHLHVFVYIDCPMCDTAIQRSLLFCYIEFISYVSIIPSEFYYSPYLLVYILRRVWDLNKQLPILSTYYSVRYTDINL